MNDLQTLKDMFKRADIVFTLKGRELTVSADYEGIGNLGYNGFLSRFAFDDQGNLISLGSWE
jgi:hypothetical protein